jgi:hypothetical protein
MQEYHNTDVAQWDAERKATEKRIAELTAELDAEKQERKNL